MHYSPSNTIHRARARLRAIYMVILALMFLPWCASAEFVVTYRMDKMDGDPSKQYDYRVLKLVLDKTIDKYGGYTLVPVPEQMNLIRTTEYAEQNTYPNLVFKQSVSREMVEKMGHIPFPVDLGIVGYRVGFVSAETRSRMAGLVTLDDLKKFSIIQGLGWLDTDILRHHGFTVLTGPRFDSLFTMVANNRGDIFMRGTNELLSEWEQYQNIDQLRYDQTFALYYPLPRFFFTNKENTLLIKRLEEGLIQSYNDNSLTELWTRFYKDSIDFVQLDKRKIFRLDNPLLEGVDNSYEKYIYDPSLH